MIQAHASPPNRARAALGSLSAVGAAIAGFGVGVLFAGRMAALAWPATIIGIVVHLFGMIGTVRLFSREGYRPSALEWSGYWLCWAIVAGLLAYAGVELLQ